MGIIYISLVVLGITSVAFLSKLSARKGVSPLDFTFVLFFTATVLGYFGARFHNATLESYPTQLLLIAAVGGAGGTFAVLMFNHAVCVGHFGFSNAIYRSSFLIPVIFSAVAFNTGLHPITATGILLILVSIFLVSWSNDSFNKGKKKEFIWFLLVMLSFLSGGFPRIAQLLISRNKLNPSAYLLVSYATGFLFLLAVYLLRGKIRIPKWAFLYGTIAACGSYVAVYCTIAALGTLPASVVFPVSLSAPILLGMLLSYMSKEKITVQGWIGVILGVTGILILALYMYG